MKTIFIIAKKKYTLKYERKMPEKEVLKMTSKIPFFDVDTKEAYQKLLKLS